MKIVNIVCSGDCNCKINFNMLSDLDDSIFSYDPEIYHGCYIKLKVGKATLYTSGKYILVGLKQYEDIDSAFFQLRTILSNFFNVSSMQCPTIQNIVAIETFNFKINLNEFCVFFKDQDIDYETEQFPGLILKIKKKITILVFSSGKVIFTGMKNKEEVSETYDFFKRCITKLR